MRRIISLSWMLIAMLMAPVLATAQDGKVTTAHENPASVQQNTLSKLQSISGTAITVQPKDVKIQASHTVTALTAGQQPTARKAVARRGVAVADITGDYVITYSSLTSSGADGGRHATITPIEGSDSIIIKGFYYSDAYVRAHVNTETGEISIPRQVLGNTTQGVLDLSVVNTNGTPNRTAKITGQVNADGTIAFSSWWAIFLNGSGYTDAIVYAGYQTSLERTNGTLSYSDPSGLNTYGVIIKQSAANVVSVKNFGNWGVTVDIELNSDSTATSPSQAARHDKTNGDWMTYAATYSQREDGTWGLSGYSAVINTEKATTGNVIKWGGWTLLNFTAGQYIGNQFDGTLTWNTGTFSYPKLSVSEFTGEGTESSPYLIKTLDDLILLSDKVNSNTNYDYGTGTALYARNFLGKYFRLENDIDMGGYRFTPIGNKWSSYFAGTFDGQGHTIKNLKISTGSAGYAALFGKADTLSVIKNLNVDSADVSSTYYYAAAIAGWTLGTIENCHVTNSTIYGTGLGVAGVAGIAAYIRNSSTENTTITGLGGFTAGVVGEVDRAISNCYASATTVNAGALADGYPAGGVVGELYRSMAATTPSTASDLYFAGSVNGAYNRSSNMEVGGVLGIAYRSTVERVYNTGNVTGYDSQAHVGGIVGRLSGSSLKQSYNVGRVTDYSSRFTGGITGYVTNTKPTADVTEYSTIEEVYTAGQVTAETYLYDKQNETRETLGTVAEDATSTLRAIYFDKQITDLTSVQYGVKTSELISAKGPEGFSADAWVFTEGFYPRLKGLDDTEVAKYGASVLLLKSDNTTAKVIDNAKLNTLGNTLFALYKSGSVYTEGYNMSVVGDSLVVNGSFGSDTLFVLNGRNNRYYVLKASPIRLEGEGSEANPFLIQTKEDLILLSNISTNLQMYFPETFFKFANDIDLEYDERFNGLCADYSDAHCQFEGTIDGDGHTIHRMKLSNVTWTKEPDSYIGDGTGTPSGNGWIGFLGRLSKEGTLKNLNIAADCDIKVWATAGALVGANYGKVINCRNYSDVLGYSCWIGGIAGSNENGGLIDGCYNEGTITSGYMNAGGITGRSYGAIRNSMNVGDVYVYKYTGFGRNYYSAGGISGSGDGALFENVINAGNVYSSNARVGGIAANLYETTSTSYAYHNDLINVINYGSVNCPDVTQVGALGGYVGSYNVTKGQVKDVYWDGQASPVKAVANQSLKGALAVETSVLTSGQRVGELPDSVFQFDEGLYPVLKAFAAEPKVQRARAIYPRIHSGETAYDLTSDFTLNGPEGTTWKLYQNKDFQLSEGTVSVPKNNTVLLTDTLVATNADITKTIILKRLYTLPLAGEGTAASPYLLKSTTDWNNLTKYMDECEQTFEGKYVQVANDFAVAEGEPINPLGSTAFAFQGDLDGAGHTISGVQLTTTATNQGLITTIGASSSVHDLTVEGAVSSEFNNTGGLTGTLAGKLSNYTNRIAVTSTRMYTGGVAGEVKADAVLENVVNEAEVSSNNSYVAGIAGSVSQGAKFHHVANKGKVSQTGTANYIAGLVAYSYPATYIGSYNEGEISVANTDNTQYAGGLISAVTAGTGTFVIDSCYNAANITAKAFVAGLIASTTSVKYLVNMTNSYNTGDIVAASSTSVSTAPTTGIATVITGGSSYKNVWNSGTIVSEKNIYAAGLFGYDVANASLETFVDSCYNLGDVTANGNQGAGLIAYTPNYTTITNCYNKGNVEGTWGVAGLVNCLSGSSTSIRNCWNEGNISGTSNRVGGIIAYGTPAGIFDCVNFGNISTSSEVKGTSTDAGYGIAGIAGQVSGKVERCANYGTITGTSFVAGIVGRANGAGKSATASNTAISECYNAGKIVCDADSCGNIVGVSVENNGNTWGAYNVLENSYYIADGVQRLDAPLAKAATIAELGAVKLGDGWADTDDYTFPVQKALSSNAALLVNAAAVVPADGDTYDNITRGFNVGAPEGLKWTASENVLNISEVYALFTTAYSGKLTLTATLGDYSKTVELTANVSTEGISNSALGKQVVREEVFTTAGQRVNGATAKGQVVIVRKTFSDGTQKTVKEVR